MILPVYNSLQEKANLFEDRYKRIDIWSDMQKLLSKLNSSNMVFRGMSEAKHKNYTSIQRHYIINELDKIGMSFSQIMKKEVEALITSNKNLIKRYYDSLGIEINWFLLNSFLQHYGGKTPFLDFSKNPLVSLYFMQDGTKISPKGKDDIDNYSSFYYIKTDNIETLSSLLKNLVDKFSNGYEKIDQRLEEYKNKYPDLYKMTNESLVPYRQNAKVLIDTFLSDSFYGWYEDLLAYCEDEDIFLLIDDGTINLDSAPLNYHKHVITATNLNLIAQEGIFVMRAGKNPLENKEVYCVDIHKSLVPNIRKYLKDKNITSDVLFPQEETIAKQALEQSLFLKM